MKKTSVLCMVVMLILGGVIFGQELEIDLVETYTAGDLYARALALEKAYPDLIHLEVIGYSQGSQPIYALIITENPQEVLKDRRTYVDKMHFFVEGGIHSRENVSPVVLLKIAETYARAYNDPELLGGVSLKSYLRDNVIHMIPLTNPDGYDLANFGLRSLNRSALNKVMYLDLSPFKDMKSNLSGVDLNRNFPGLYYDENKERFEDVWNVKLDDKVSSVPSGAFYGGPYAASEIETRVLMRYIQAYDFRNYLSFHSRGEIIYYHKWMLSDVHNAHALALAQALSERRGNGYLPYLGNVNVSSSGYLTDFSAMETLKPSLTIETVPGTASLPAGRDLIARAYNENLYVILQGIDFSRARGYFPYKLYVDNQYVRDYEEEVYGLAMARRLEGIIYEQPGKPALKVPRAYQHVSRLEMLQYVLLDTAMEKIDFVTAFEDTDNYYASWAKNKGYVTGSDNLFRPDDRALVEEAYVLVDKVFLGSDPIGDLVAYDYPVAWAQESVRRLLTLGIIERSQVTTGEINLEDLQAMIDGLNK